jgi:hypothetical protein
MDSVEIVLHGRRRADGTPYTAIVDAADYERVRAHHWYPCRVTFIDLYPQALISPGKTVKLHRFIADAPKGKAVIAKNGNYFDCRRENLQVGGHAGDNICVSPSGKRAA